MILKIIEQIAATSSRNEKEAILKVNKDNELLKEVIYLANNPFITWGIKKIPSVDTHAGVLALEQALKELESFRTRALTGNVAITTLASLLQALSVEDAEVLARIIKKDLRAGFTGNTANKIWPNLVPTYPVMLCSVFKQDLVDKIEFPAFFQVKEDGARFNAIIENGKVSYFSRKGQSLDLLGVLDGEFLTLSKGIDNIVFDGELLLKTEEGILNRQSGNGILTKAQRGTLSLKEAESIICILWDIIPLEAFRAGEYRYSYKARWELLKELYYKIPINLLFKINLVDTSIVNNLEESTALFEQFLVEGREGGILKDFRGIWEDSRSRTQIKFKGELTADLLCTGWNEGQGKDAGKCGSLTLQSSEGKIIVHVGSGLTDQLRAEFTPENTIDKIIEIKYNGRIKKKNSDIESLFLPIFKSIRLDKTKANSSEEIQ